MKKRVVNLRTEIPLLDIVSFGRGGRSPTPAQRAHIARTVRRTPEVMVKVSGGARTLAGVRRHMQYIEKKGALGLETDVGTQAGGERFADRLIEDWDLDIQALNRQSERSIRGRKPVKLVHNIIFSMPPGTSPKKVLQAVRKLAVNEWALQHRYAMALHTDEDHPHVHVVVKAVSEQGVRLNIRKVTLRSWRAQFAQNLRELGVDANATERAVRGQNQTRKSDGVYRADERGESTHMQRRRQDVIRELATKGREKSQRHAGMERTRDNVRQGWFELSDVLEAANDHELAREVRAYASQLPPARTENAQLTEKVIAQLRPAVEQQPPITR